MKDFNLEAKWREILPLAEEFRARCEAVGLPVFMAAIVATEGNRVSAHVVVAGPSERVPPPMLDLIQGFADWRDEGCSCGKCAPKAQA